jgi:glycosyltransferase involved in cell wall biosynthesis
VGEGTRECPSTLSYSIISFERFPERFRLRFLNRGRASRGTERMAKVFVSVLIDTYNHERFIEEAVRSVLRQDIPLDDAEILVVDDGSTDRTPEILKKFEPQIRVLRKTNGGQASAFNFAIPQCQGEIIALLDGDDWWTKDKLRTILAVFEANPDVGTIGHGYLMVDGGRLQKIVVPKDTMRLNVRTPENARVFAEYRCFFGTSRVAYRRAVLDRILPIPAGAVIEADEYLFTLAPFLADAIVLNQALLHYRLHERNLYMQSVTTASGNRRKYNSLAALVEGLNQELHTLGVPREIEDSLLTPLRLETDRMRLQLEGGSRWEMFNVERATNRLFYSNAPLGYRIFKQMALLMTFLVPPKQFLGLKHWYASKALSKLRSHIGDPVPVDHLVERHFEPGYSELKQP